MAMEDEQAMQAVRDGEIGRLELLFDRHHRALYHYFLHLTGNPSASEDLVQEVFFRILKYRQTYRPEASFRAWMFQIGRNAYLDQAGRQKGEVALPEEVPEMSVAAAAAPDRQVENKQETALLRRALAALPSEKREVIVMSRFLELKYDEIASILKCEVGTVKVRVYRALRELGDLFFALRGEKTAG
jgi:RNA polymerase sigma factor (sigma-70 family)